MKDNTLSKLGGNCSILLGILYLVIGITYLLLPADQKQTSAVDKFLPSFAENPTTQIIQFWGFALSGLIAIAVVLAVSESVRSENEGWVRWTSTLAILGFAVIAINNFRNIAYQPGLARAYVEGDAVTKAAIELGGPFRLTTGLAGLRGRRSVGVGSQPAGSSRWHLAQTSDLCRHCRRCCILVDSGWLCFQSGGRCLPLGQRWVASFLRRSGTSGQD